MVPDLLKRKRAWLATAALCAVLLTGCDKPAGGGDAAAAKAGGAAAAAAVIPKDLSLGIVPYNYSKRYVAFFDINGAGGGNIGLGGGGGGTVCCARFFKGAPLPMIVEVRYTDEFKEVMIDDGFGSMKPTIERIWKDTQLTFNGPVPANPEYAEVVFNADGSIKLYLTETRSAYGSHPGAMTPQAPATPAAAPDSSPPTSAPKGRP
jgi:Protein of unknown function (DUF3304)